MSLPQDSIQATCTVCSTVTTYWRNLEGDTLCESCYSDTTKNLSNYETSC